MRFLRQTSPDQIRLGWLRLIAGIVGTERLPLDSLRASILSLQGNFEPWIDEAGFSVSPRGNVPPSRIDRLAAMGVNFGIYDTTTETLTEIGHVLRAVAPWSPDDGNPLVWRGASRWIAFYIVVQAAGDVVLPLLSGWPTEEQTTAEVAERLSEVLDTLARKAREDRSVLRKQAEGASPQQKSFKAHTVLYPYVELLRDLGYLERTTVVGGGAGYRLTEAGSRLRSERQRFEGDTEALLRSGISRVFLRGEGVELLRPSTGREFANTLATIPKELTVLRREEVLLDAAVLLAQAKFLDEAPGAWIDRQRAHALLNAAAHRGISIAVKRGGSVKDLNVAWESAAVLAEERGWDVDVPVDEPVAHKAESAAPTRIDSTAEVLAPIGSTKEASSETGTTNERETEPSVIPTEPPKQEVSDPDALLRTAVPVHQRLWLHYVDQLLSPPQRGALDVVRWGGLVMAMARLDGLLMDLPEHRLREKRALRHDEILHPQAQKPSTNPYCLHPLARLEPMLRAIEEDWVVQRIQQTWLDDGSRDPRPVLERGRRYAATVADKLRTDIDAFLDLPPENTSFWKRWDTAREATRSIIHDAIAAGIGSARSLRERLHRELRRQRPRDAASAFLNVLFAKPWSARYTQHRRLPLDVVTQLELDKANASASDDIEIRIGPIASEDGTHIVEFILQTQARSNFEARQMGRQRVHALLSERFARRVMPEPDVTIDLHERVAYEHVESIEAHSMEHADREEPLDADRSFPGLAPYRRDSSAPALRANPSRGTETSVPRQRILRARREILDTRRPGLNGEQRTMLAWMAMERLVATGLQSKVETIPCLAAPAALLHLKGTFTRILHDARAGLWLSACMEPQNEPLARLVAQWLPDLSEEQRAVLDPEAVPSMRRKRVMDRIPALGEESSLRWLWEQRRTLLEFKDVLTVWAPFAAAGLHDYLVITGEEKDTKRESVGNGTKLADYFRQLYEDIASFFAHVYETRNRAAHGGETLERDHAAIELYQRFIALTEPVLDAAERWVDRGLTLEQVFGLALDKASDLAGLPHSKPGRKLDLGRLDELLAF
ncbi:hypothetical protein [Polyangium mundeleinium]|uniref:Apea-like HEPN domain-containing protein n=1 Tax=Polyangium mundeleinium TaxID=2995306 RepID=A0ABT5F542_9BACT|nr:hypothetical protein [Polyangium mundeleinium]MDC0749071.1 hypothetical protein [Polyangium mundeleinium]